MAKIFIQTVGCRLNQAESEQMAQTFRLAGHKLVRDEKTADWKVINTCTVTGAAGAKIRRAAKRSHAEQHVIVTGCHSEMEPDQFSEADLVIHNSEKEELAGLVMERFGMDGLALGADLKDKRALQMYPLVLDHTRAFVKIQDGCDMRCSFCLTTFARGASRCRPPEEIIAEIRTLAEKGCMEVVLTGVHAGSYQYQNTDLGTLMDQILKETDVPRLRLSSLEPWNFKYSWLDLWTDHGERCCRHLHMSLQSGSDTVLKRMRRIYNRASYAEKIERIRAACPDMAVTTDIIVGFPGETESEHTESLTFSRELKFARTHVFSYSRRPGTEAAGMPDQVSGDIKRCRLHEMQTVAESSQLMFAAGLDETVQAVLWEQQLEDGRCSGLTDHYVQVHSQEPDMARLNTIEHVRVKFSNSPVLAAV